MKPRHLLLAACLLSLFWIGPARAANSDEAAVKELARIGYFAFGGIGYAGARSRADILFEQIAREPNRAVLFRELWERGNNQGKLYALLGLYWIKDPTANSLAQQLISVDAQVATARGCLVGIPDSARDLLPSVKSGEHLSNYFPGLAKL